FVERISDSPLQGLPKLADVSYAVPILESVCLELGCADSGEARNFAPEFVPPQLTVFDAPWRNGHHLRCGNNPCQIQQFRFHPLTFSPYVIPRLHVHW